MWEGDRRRSAEPVEVEDVGAALPSGHLPGDHREPTVPGCATQEVYIIYSGAHPDPGFLGHPDPVKNGPDLQH